MFLIALLPLLPKFPLGANKVIFYSMLFYSRAGLERGKTDLGLGRGQSGGAVVKQLD